MRHLKINKSKVIIFLFFPFFLVSCSFPWFQNVSAEPVETRIINMSLYLGDFPNETMAELLDWLKQVNYTRWTLALEPCSNGTHCNAFFNKTFIDALKQYGELTPTLPFGIQNFPPEIRREFVDGLFDHWETYIRYKPKGFFQFQPDTYTCNYILERGCEYWQGYCLDQHYMVDWMDMRGGWQMPYYASTEHALVPKREGKGLVILPHNTWDWRASVEYDHQFNTHLLNALCMFNNDWTPAREYLVDLINKTLNDVAPFGYVAIQHEWLWIYQLERLAELKEYTLAVMNLTCTFQTFGETVDWFKQNYANNPDYNVNFVTPYDGKKVEWLWKRNFRVTRYDERYVVGYIDYTQQSIDQYINKTADCDFLGEKNETNNFCTSLEFLIDDFGNAVARASSKGNRKSFLGALEDFPSYFTRLQNDGASPTIHSPFQQPSSDAVFSHQQVEVLVSIVDMESGVKNATLYFNLNSSTEWKIIPMSCNQGSNLYRAVIPAQVENTYVKYKIVAYDNADNRAEQNNDAQYFTYKVLPESLPISMFLLPILLLLTAFLITYRWHRHRETTKRGLCFMRRLVSTEALTILIFFLLSLRVILWFEFPRIIVSGDLRPPLNTEAFTIHAAYVWNEIDFGTISVYLPRILDPFNFLIIISCKLGFDIYTSQIVALVIMYFLLSILIYTYVKELTDGDAISAFVAGLFFNFNLFLINDREQTAVGFVSIALMVLPSLVIFTRALRKRSERLVVLSGMLFILTQGTFPNYRPFLLGLFAIFLTTFYFLIRRGVRVSLSDARERCWLRASIDTRPILDCLKSLGVFLVSAVLASIWVIVLITANLTPLLSAHSRMTTPIFALNLQFHDVFRLIGHWAFYGEYPPGHPYVPYAYPYLHDPVVIFWTFLIPVIAFTSLLTKSRTKVLELYFASVGLIFLFFTAGFTEYFRDIYYSVTTHVPLLIAFRTPTNWIFFVLLSYSILLGTLVCNICTKFKGKLPKLFVLGLTALLLISVSFPLITGDVTRNWLRPEVKGSVFPKSYAELDNKLSNVYWALLLPKRDVYVIYNYSSGTLGCGNPYPFIFSKPIISGIGTEYLDPKNLDLIDQLHELILMQNDTVWNIAPKGEISASSFQDAYREPSKANDESYGTRWASQEGIPQWLEVRWTRPQELEGVRIFFEEAYAKAYVIQTWNGTDWIEQAKVENNTSLECEQMLLEHVTTEKIRLYFTEASIWNQTSIWELELYKTVRFPSLSSRGLGIFGVGYLIVEKDIVKGGVYNITEARKRLVEKQDFALVEEWDEVALYCNTFSVKKLYVANNMFMCKNWNWSDICNYLTDSSWDVLKHSIFVDMSPPNVPANESMVLPEGFTWSEVSPCKYEASLVSKGPFFVAFLETYDKQWKLRVNGKTVPESEHFKINTFGNGWFVNATGNLSLEITFETQDIIAPSIVISLLLPILLVAKNQLKKLAKSVRRFFDF